MSDWFGERAAALVGLRRAQTRVVTRVVPEIATEPGASATPSVLEVDGPRGGRYVRQRVCVERTAAPFDADAVFDAAEAEWGADGGASSVTARKRDGAPRFDLTTRDGEFHSLTLLHGGRVMQLTSFSRELDVRGAVDGEDDDARDRPAADGAAGDGDDDDAFSADTLAAPLDHADLAEQAAARAREAGDPRPEHVMLEEREAGPDYGYRLHGDR